MSIKIVPLRLATNVMQGDDLSKHVADALAQSSEQLAEGDILVIAQKVVSKCEGRVVRLAEVQASPQARKIAQAHDKEPALIELVLRESKEIITTKRGIIITETPHGFVCANSGVDQSNVEGDFAVLLPTDPDTSALKLRRAIKNQFGKDIAIIITDTFGRAFRIGQINVAIGVSGIAPLRSYIGSKDMFGKLLKVTEIAVADEIASAAELVMGKSEGIPFAIVRGYPYERTGDSNARLLVRRKKDDLFR